MNATQPTSPIDPERDFESWLPTQRWGLLARHRWLVFVLPLAVYMLAGNLEPKPPAGSSRHQASKSGGEESGLGATGNHGPRAAGQTSSWSNYPFIYFLRLVLTCAAVAFVWPGYREFAFRVSPLAVPVGIVGVVIWVGICRLDLETLWLKPIGLSTLLGLGQRVAFDPYQYFQGQTVPLLGFVTTRMVGLALVVPVIEEYFLRGFVLRMVTEPRWWELPFGKVSVGAIAVGIAYGPLAHPAEFFAALAWFTLIMGLMLKTRSMWDCIVAHMVTNLLLGVYVLIWRDWSLW